MANWYTADTHFSHENVIAHCNRPFRSAAEMDTVLIENMWKVVKPDDELWIIGDFAFGPKAKEASYLAGVFSQLPGVKKHLAVGNHDLNPTLELPWDSIHCLVEVKDGPQNQAITLCHYPMITWNDARRQALHLFGHVHNSWKGSRNAVNVGDDVWNFKPVSLQQAAQRAKSLPINKHWSDVEPRA
ncbi:metallophosphoesterase [Ruegeria sp. 2205SS24-7]|uniref:metallophosphoesterase n=1 Tax=Ruegeria discodermiae TaxID=3064389 RepID=UPI0027417CF6|nr:metallophosphoesterase [Ruegeria sp. 2205SS24-7]MDP5220369.1 metallophosphoesterase [Ruegeria sp. 2205SS24-7]